jgi:hypothetical protein
MKYLLPLLAILVFASCKFDLKDNDAKDPDQTERESSKKKDSDDKLDEFTKAIEELSEGKSVETVPYQELQELLPSRLEGYERVDLEGSRTGALGIKVSTATATYEDGDQEIEINIVDGGSFGGVLSSAQNWMDAEFERSSKDGFERTSTLKGYKSYEQFDKNGTSSLAVIVQDRYLVTASGRVKDFDQLKDMVESMKLRKLKKE